MMTSENSVQEIQQAEETENFFAKMSTRVGDALDSLKSEQFKSGISDGTTKVSDAYDQVKGKIGLKDYQKMGQALKEWLPTLATGNGLAKKLRTETKAATGWLAQLPDKEMAAFAQAIYAHCTMLDFDLEWLLDPELNKIMDEQLRQSLEEIVLLYCLATWKADQASSGIRVFVNLQAWLGDPFAKQYETFNQQLFTKLVAEELTPAPSLELFLAPEEEREEYSVQAIKDMIAEKNQRFYQILKAQVESAAVESAAATDGDDEPSEAESTESS